MNPQQKARKAGKKPKRPKTGSADAGVPDASPKDWLLFQIATGLVGVGLVALGMFGVFQGVEVLPGNQTQASTPTLESSFAFQSALVIGLGLSMLIVTARPARSGLLLASLAGIVFLGGLARLMSWAIFGLPSGLLVLSMVCELVIPPLLIVWRGWIVRSRQLRSEAVAAAAGKQPAPQHPPAQSSPAQPPQQGSPASQQHPPGPPAPPQQGRPGGPGQSGYPGQP